MSFDLAKLRNLLSGALQIFPYKNTVSIAVFALSFYWFIQDIYAILLSIHIKQGIKGENITCGK